MITDFVICARLHNMIADVVAAVSTIASIGQDEDSAIFEAHIVQRAPARQVGAVIMPDIAGILMLGEFGVGIGRLDHVLFVE